MAVPFNSGQRGWPKSWHSIWTADSKTDGGRWQCQISCLETPCNVLFKRPNYYTFNYFHLRRNAKWGPKAFQGKPLFLFLGIWSFLEENLVEPRTCFFFIRDISQAILKIHNNKHNWLTHYQIRQPSLYAICISNILQSLSV